MIIIASMIRLALLLLVGASLLVRPAEVANGAPLPQVPLGDPAQALLDQMTPAERVGQLFMVAFVGRDLNPGGQIATLLQEDKIGSVVLLAANGNFRNGDDTPRQVAALTEALQGLVTGPNGVTGIPLLIAIDHEGDGYPYSRITSGVTPLASPLAIGATWDPALAEATGYVAGLELAAMGINMILGPSVDVLHSPGPSSKGDLGIRTFGGDPFWVGRMGRAYVQGVHEGSQGRVLTVAKHFPGHGGSDRLPDDEVATVDKSLEELRRVELAPFFAVTAAPPGSHPGVTDALMTSHIRYRGFQGEDVGQLAAPISFDPAGLQALLSQEEFEIWREQGLMVSDALGVPAVRKYFDPTLQLFPHRQIARQALNAGNDLLILAQFDLNDRWADQYTNIRDTMAFFREQYEIDSAFRVRVDQAALKVLRLKMRLYPSLEQGRGQAVLPLTNPDIAGRRNQVTETVARYGLTLLYPRSPDDLAARLPAAPRRDEQIVIFTDAREVRDCFDPDCQPFLSVPVEAIQEAILRLYGPEATNEVAPEQIRSFSFGDLKRFLASSIHIGGPVVADGQAAIQAAGQADAPDPAASAVAEALQTSDWVVLIMQDLVPGEGRPGASDSDAARIFLDTTADSLFDRKIVAFALNVPYVLDTTEISKLSAYFALYSKQPPFLEMVARTLFNDAVPAGSPSVSVEAVNYELATQLQPNPNYALPLTLVSTGPFTVPAEAEVRVGPILDSNDHIVPDGTVVEVWGSWEVDGATTERMRGETTDGVALIRVPIMQGGRLTLHASSFRATSHEAVTLAAVGPAPTPTATATLAPTPRATVRREATPTEAVLALTEATATFPAAAARVQPSPTQVVSTEPMAVVPAPERATSVVALPLALAVMTLVAGAVLRWAGALTVQSVRRATLVLIGGLAAYIAARGWWAGMDQVLPLVGASVGGSVLGLVIGLVWPGPEPEGR
ncbi:MAG TPA: glycoside hydrolase family 3 N-terminal domain-containing protein [Ardenticatenaceae bacterium]|nr:glycoside hydrolase family 3 N-terminal domain-containing protein [Ardenticatenaceae bacterium]